MFTKFSLLDWVACLLFSLFTLGLLISYIERPVYNHDLSGYLGVVLSYEESDPKVVHSEVFDRLKKTVPPHRFERLVGAASDSAPAVRILGQDAEAFRQSLTFYEVRIAYTGLIFLLSKFGVEPIFASHAISAVSVFGSLWVFVFMFKGVAPFPYLFFLPLIALGIGLHELAQLSSPDAMGLLGWSLAFLFFLRRHYAVLVLFPILVLTRTDYVLFVVIANLYLLSSKAFNPIFVVLSMMASLLAYFGINHYYQGYGLIAALNYMYYYGQVAFPETAEINFGLSAYFELLLGALSNSHASGNRVFYLFLLFGGLAFFLLRRAASRAEANLRRGLYDLGFVLMGGLCYIVGHVLLVPRFDDRYFSFLYMFAPCLLVFLITTRLPLFSSDFVGVKRTTDGAK